VNVARNELKGMLRSGARGYALCVGWEVTVELKLPDYSVELAHRKLQFVDKA
jgi:hypothetical protein